MRKLSPEKTLSNDWGGTVKAILWGEKRHHVKSRWLGWPYNIIFRQDISESERDALIIMLGQQVWTRSVPNKLEFMVAVLKPLDHVDPWLLDPAAPSRKHPQLTNQFSLCMPTSGSADAEDRVGCLETSFLSSRQIEGAWDQTRWGGHLFLIWAFFHPWCFSKRSCKA